MSLSGKPTQSVIAYRIAHPAVIASAIRLTLALFALGCLSQVAFAQSTATPVTPGYLDSNNCPPGFSVCFHQYGASTGPGGPVTVADGADVAEGSKNDTSVTGTVIGFLNGIFGTQTAIQGTPTGSVPATVAFTEPVDKNGNALDFSASSIVTLSSQYPNGATAITGPATGTTGSVVGTLAATSGKTTYICGFDVSAIGGTAAIGPITIAGLKGGSFVYQLNSAAAAVNFTKNYAPCIPASGTNTAITTTTTADGTATAVDVNSYGYQQ